MENKYSDRLRKIIDTRKKILDIHPFLEELYPVAIVEDDHFLVHDLDDVTGEYRFAGRFPTPMPVPPGVKAAFHLECYGNRIACVVSGDVLDESDGIVTVFHEFTHCMQSEICEEELKQQLEVAVKAREADDFMWELNHPFPYDDRDFTALYGSILKAEDLPDIEEYRNKLEEHLEPLDYQYMVWQEWKEGFARLIENRIRKKLRLFENRYGGEPPYDRIAFYSGGEHYIGALNEKDSNILFDIEALFHRMLSRPDRS